MARTAKVERETTETQIMVELVLDGTGTGNIETSIPFFDHMLGNLGRHSLINMTIKGSGDTDVDDHHLVEDTGICIGQAIKKALGTKECIRRYGSAFVPMDESLCHVSVDLSGRPYMVYNAVLDDKEVGGFELVHLREFFKALSDHGGITLHINVIYGRNPHHIAESIFKALARALGEAISIDDRIAGVMSTKGNL
ncbi:MAG: imidazoleglycerol-phosphate dehydratase HisB [Syntrophales bacterium]|jgi:imidazoleglycerol-phosphate dehydratase|nr:imidazoleglycerol-phosphate dehydratase HisB [Syntrophales bacterium]MDY0043390.1 imidazoleglycerol-phosphate dehydratase HisB [Syntrophales bacterium]